MRVAGRLTWRDASGTLRFVSVVTRDVSDVDAFVECQAPTVDPALSAGALPDRAPGARRSDLPAVLQQGKVLSAVYRVGPYKSATGTPQGYALRLLIEPSAATASSRTRQPRGRELARTR